MSDSLHMQRLSSVLVIDPDESHRRGTSLALKELFQEIKHVSRPQEALSLVAVESFDMIITEVRFPTTDGIKMLEGIRQVTPETPIIICSVHDVNVLGDVLETLKIDGFLEKPVELESLKERIKKIIKQNE